MLDNHIELKSASVVININTRLCCLRHCTALTITLLSRTALPSSKALPSPEALASGETLPSPTQRSKSTIIVDFRSAFRYVCSWFTASASSPNGKIIEADSSGPTRSLPTKPSEDVGLFVMNQTIYLDDQVRRPQP